MRVTAEVARRNIGDDERIEVRARQTQVKAMVSTAKIAPIHSTLSCNNDR